jgi:DNA-binding CsgD family transcriptional regulator
VGQDLADVGAALHATIDTDQPGATLVAAGFGYDDPRWQAMADEIAAAAAPLHASIGAAARLHLDAAGAALVGRRCRLICSDERFRDWIGEPAFSADCRRLARRAAAGKTAIGLVTALDGRVAPLYGKPMGGREDGVLLIAFAPLPPSPLARRAGAALGLSPLEAKLAETLLEAPGLYRVAATLGLGRKTAKHALARAMLKAGVRKPADLVRRLRDLER